MANAIEMSELPSAYRTGNAELDAEIAALVAHVDPSEQELVFEMVVSALRLAAEKVEALLTAAAGVHLFVSLHRWLASRRVLADKLLAPGRGTTVQCLTGRRAI